MYLKALKSGNSVDQYICGIYVGEGKPRLPHLSAFVWYNFTLVLGVTILSYF